MIEVRDLTKRYGSKVAVAGASFQVFPGKVTGFLGPNGAGKSTTMRAIMGLDNPTSGMALVNGRRYQDLKAPLTEVGALLDAKAVHTGRSAYSHLRAMAATHGLPSRRVNEVIELTGLGAVAKKRVGGFSLGMGQRLGIAAALLGDPQTLILDEPINGLDPEGVMWVRELVKTLADQGRTIFLSSHLMSEMSKTADHIIVIGKGRIMANDTMANFVARGSRKQIKVVSPNSVLLQTAVANAGGVLVSQDGPNGFIFEGVSAGEIGKIAFQQQIELHEVTPIETSLEAAYMELTRDAVEYQSAKVAQ